jgi:hypothetical protein
MVKGALRKNRFRISDILGTAVFDSAAFFVLFQPVISSRLIPAA